MSQKINHAYLFFINIVISALLILVFLWLGFMISGLGFGMFGGTIAPFMALIFIKAKNPIWYLIMMIYGIISLIAFSILYQDYDIFREGYASIPIISNIIIHSISTTILFDYFGAKKLISKTMISILFLSIYGVLSLFAIATLIGVTTLIISV